MAIITPFLIELGKKGIEKFTEKGFESISEGTINWFKTLFFKDDKPKKALLELQQEPENKEKQNIAKAIIENSIEDNPEFEKFLKEILEKLPKVESTITNSKNVNTGNINSGGGNIQLGDNYGNL
ncbi:hypothetical protein [Flavobacterium sp. SOK18b]|uniref:hypothetical protein n=1 Tax=Flavobacterium sp. SOK18b TaxID=797900 RepID=UPI0015FE3239|nr:hypothetical protein [Flavobacterium sp. SOK18b]